MPFSTLGLSRSLCTPLAKLGYTTPTPVQAQSIPIVLTGRDLLARAQTGTGKTAAFGLPMIDRLLIRGGTHAGPRKPRGLVLVPTRELALQVHKSLAAYGVPANLRVAAIFGGVSIGPQKQALQRGTDIVVATPGRLLDHMEQRTVDLSAVEILVLDEADRMLDMGFLPPLKRILVTVPKKRQTLLFSATFSKEVVELSSAFTHDAGRVDVSEGQVVASTVTHRVHPVSEARKGDLLTYVLKQDPGGQALVFCRTKRGSNRVGAHLELGGVKAAVIHGNKSQNARTRALDDFKAGTVNVLVATDIAARGLDIAQLPLVVNFDLPLVAEDYIHRVGRTGRAGLPGRAVSLVSPADRDLLRDIQKLLTDPIKQVLIEDFPVTPHVPRHDAVRPRRHAQARPHHAPKSGQRSGAPARSQGHDSRPKAASHGHDSRPKPASHGHDSRPKAASHGHDSRPKPPSHGHDPRPKPASPARPAGTGRPAPHTAHMSPPASSRPAGSRPPGGRPHGSRPPSPHGGRPRSRGPRR